MVNKQESTVVIFLCASAGEYKCAAFPIGLCLSSPEEKGGSEPDKDIQLAQVCGRRLQQSEHAAAG